MKKCFLVIIACMIGLLLIIDVCLFIQGSLEGFPTPEQIEKGRIAYGFISIPLVITEIFLISKIFHKNEKPIDR